MARVANSGNVCLKDLAVKESSLLHALFAEDGAQLDEGINVISRVEERETLAEEGQEDDSTAPVVDQACLPSTFEKNFWGTEATRAGSGGAAG